MLIHADDPSVLRTDEVHFRHGAAILAGGGCLCPGTAAIVRPVEPPIIAGDYTRIAIKEPDVVKAKGSRRRAGRRRPCPPSICGAREVSAVGNQPSQSIVKKVDVVYVAECVALPGPFRFLGKD